MNTDFQSTVRLTNDRLQSSKAAGDVQRYRWWAGFKVGYLLASKHAAEKSLVPSPGIEPGRPQGPAF